MSTSGLLNRMRQGRIIAVFLTMLLAYGAVSYSPLADSPWKPYSVDIGGVTGAANNTVLAFGRYVLVAPHFPSKGMAENGELDLEQLDNFYIRIIDTKKTADPPQSQELTAWDPQSQTTRKVYFPTRMIFDPISSTVYVRGTRFEQTEEDVIAVDVLAYVHVNLDSANGKALLFDKPVVIDIPGVSDKYTDDAPVDYALGRGNFLIYTNGATMFSFNVTTGELNRAEIVPANLYSQDNSISFLDVDESNIVSVCWSTKTVGKDDTVNFSSELSFYQLDEKGPFNLVKRVYPDQFPEGTALMPGSNIAIISDPDKHDPEFALFATNDGSLCQVDLAGDDVRTTPKTLYKFAELATASGANPGSLVIRYDASKRVVGIVKPGFTVQISRPSNGKRGRISRPSNLHLASGDAVLAMAKFGKKNKITSSNSFSEDFRDGDGLSNFVNGEDSQWLISTYSGRLYSIGIESDLRDSKVQFVGPMGSRVGHIDYYSDRTSVVAINSFTLDEAGMRIASPGSLVVGRMVDRQSQSTSGAALQTLLPVASGLAKPIPSIRRPSNLRR